MKKLILLAITILSTINVYSQITINDFSDAKIYFDGLFSQLEKSDIDRYGNMIINMGSASSGRVLLRITDVNIEIEERPEETGCADICPPRVIINFKCRKKDSDCVRDPAFSEQGYQSSSITIFNVKRGRKAFEFLKAFKLFILKDIETAD